MKWKAKNGIEIVDDIYQYLISNAIYQRSYTIKILRQLTHSYYRGLLRRGSWLTCQSRGEKETFTSALSAIGRPAASATAASPLRHNMRAGKHERLPTRNP
ncbi:hypothetical protein J4732_08840 [Serratia marcescens]|uniref:Uncharacterized protein n=1 Tax=Serratia marcescens TaxID=615 RepID=A0A939NJS4_SERMA|nr:hypothetical protein [Serratia marcescens]